MPMKNNKQQVLTFKADKSLVEAISSVSNRSEFIRNAILSALDSSCPLCNGTGTLTPNQKSHWEKLRADHYMKQCGKCHENYIVCRNRENQKGCAGHGG